MNWRFISTLLIALSLGAAGTAVPARAQSCGEDLQKLAQKREAQLEIINGLIKSAKGKQLDPTVFCAKSAGLNTAETAMLAYMVKNKDWCEIPDQAIEALKANHAKSVAFSGKACQVAAQLKKMKEQQAQGGAQAQPLPAGPL